MTLLKRRTFLTAAATALALPAIVGRAEAATTIKISTSWSNDPRYSTARIWFDCFLPHLKEETNGEISAQLYPDSQLGTDADIMGQQQLGVVDIMIAGSSIWGNVVPEIAVFDLGYAIHDYAHLQRAVATPAVTDLEATMLDKAGIRVPGWFRPAGARNVLTKGGFKDSDGLKGQKIRTIPNPIVTQTLKLMGAASTPLAFGEVYTALQAGVLDGVEHDIPTILTSKFYETAKRITLTNHLVQPILATLSDRCLQRLKSAQQEQLVQAIKKTTPDVYSHFDALESGATDELAKLGVAIQQCDKAAFRDRVRPLWDEFVKNTPSAQPLLDAIKKTETA